MAVHSVDTGDFGKKVASQLTSDQTAEIQKLVLWIEGITEVAGIAASAADHNPSDNAVNNALWAARSLAGQIIDIVNAGRPSAGRG